MRHIVSSYDEELKNLTNTILSMGEHLDELLALIEKALKSPEESFIKIANQIDSNINAYDTRLENDAIEMIALRQPMGIDLRLIISCLKISVILERVGDLTKSIVRRAVTSLNQADQQILDYIYKMLGIIRPSLKGSIDAFINKDGNAASEMLNKEQEIDLIYNEALVYMRDNCIKDAQDSAPIMHIVFALKNIERIGDYVTKIALMVIYVTSGKKADKPPKYEGTV